MTNPAQINTLSEFLMQAQTQYIVFDMGRGLRQIDNQLFFEWENQQSPCAYPRQNHVWLCIVFWNEKVSEERYIWFVKLPLDENGLIVQASRNEFLEIIVKALGQQLEHQQKSSAQLPDNPYIFVPSQQQLADCNAHIRRVLNIASNSSKERREQLLAYLKAPQLTENSAIWQHFSVQDIADFVIHPENEVDAPQSIIAQNINQYPKAVVNCLLASLETVPVSMQLCQALIAYRDENSTSPIASLCLRAMSFQKNDCNDTYVKELINDKESHLDIETVVVIAGRYWRIFSDRICLNEFMQKVAVLDEKYEVFKAIYSDLVKIPECRSYMLAFLREPERSQHLSAAIGSLFSN